MGQGPPLPEAGERWALFLDVDGTLVAIAATPEQARPDPALLPLLERLSRVSEGALALVSGRSLASIDQLFAPLLLPAAGLHGWERRRSDGSVVRREPVAAPLARLRPRLAAYAAARPGLLLEDKGASLALHYRLVPERGAALRRFARDLAAAEPELRLLTGRKVVELQPRGADKGQAILAFLDEPAFAGRRPVFAGDDATDEDGFAAVNAAGGVSLRVVDTETRGRRHSTARYSLQGMATLREWLDALAQRLDTGERGTHTGTAGFHPVLNS
jgi:trehalose 6-phosphate phosphatase